MGDVSKGQIREGLGTALFNVHYSCLVLRPHKGEVMDCVVTSASKVKLRKQPVQSRSIACSPATSIARQCRKAHRTGLHRSGPPLYILCTGLQYVLRLS